jgi:hypothetical protein
MAELLTIDGQEYKKRSPWGAWLLCLTVVYIFIWYYKISKELKQYTAEDSSPGLRTLGIIVPILNLVIHWRTGDQTSRAEEKAGVTKTVEPILAVLASLFYFLIVPYIQSHLNKLWDAAAARSASAAGPAMPPAPPPVPPAPPPAGL